MMGGRIEVQSTPGQGSRFAFDIPLRTLTECSDDLPRLLDSRTALLCSLDSQGLDCLSHLLSRWGMRTQRCQDPERLQDFPADFASPPLLVLMAPWPGSSSQWLDCFAPVPGTGAAGPLLSPLEQYHPLPEGLGLRLLGLPLPLSVTVLRATLLKLYSERRQAEALACRRRSNGAMAVRRASWWPRTTG